MLLRVSQGADDGSAETGLGRGVRPPSDGREPGPPWGGDRGHGGEAGDEFDRDWEAAARL